MTEWLRVGEWVLSVADIAAVHYEDTPEGPTAEVFTVSGGESRRQLRGGYSAKGEEALVIWSYFCVMSTDILSDDPVLHRRVKV